MAAHLGMGAYQTNECMQINDRVLLLLVALEII